LVEVDPLFIWQEVDQGPNVFPFMAPVPLHAVENEGRRVWAAVDKSESFGLYLYPAASSFLDRVMDHAAGGPSRLGS
jgi:hypothetical protein